ncbi:MAG: hypothetical protein WBP41_02205 [Saprospiraceae bacterium]
MDHRPQTIDNGQGLCTRTIDKVPQTLIRIYLMCMIFISLNYPWSAVYRLWSIVYFLFRNINDFIT